MRTFLAACMLVSSLATSFAASTARAQSLPALGALPRTGGGEHDVGVIVATSRPFALPAVPGAVDNATEWLSWLTQTRGVPSTRVQLLRDQDATREGIEDALVQATKDARADGMLWFVFIGHGAPDVDTGEGLLLGVDAQPTEKSIHARGLPRARVLELVRAGQQRAAVVVLDACFSGQTPDGAAPLIAGMQATLPTRKAAAVPRIVVLSSSARVAGPLPGHDRPAFSYLLLGALRGWGDADRDHVVTLGEAYSFVDTTLTTVVRDRDQRPSSMGGDASWVLATSTHELSPDIATAARRGPTSTTNAGQPPAATASRAPFGVTLVDEPGGGARVLAVREGSRAAAVGVHARDVIVSISGVAIANSAHFGQLYASIPDDGKFGLDVRHEHDTLKGVPYAPSAPAQPAPAHDAPRTAPATTSGVDAEAARCLQGNDVAQCMSAIQSASAAHRYDLLATTGLRACQLGRFDLCENVATELIHQGNTTDAFRFMQAGCNGGHARSCAGIAMMQVRGIPGIPQNPPQAFQLASRACATGDGDSCMVLAECYAHGFGVTQDPIAALSSLSQSCQLGSAQGCDQLGEAYDSSGNAMLSSQAHARACQLDEQFCD